jgi:uncharacterized membrane protein YeaQ/YmgE (transglycosylase-associated protein family)
LILSKDQSPFLTDDKEVPPHVTAATWRAERHFRQPGFHLTCREENAMNFIIWIVIGGVLGWLASIVMKTNAQQGMILNVVVGVVGALVGGWLLAPMVGTGTINQGDFSVAALVVSFVGALVLLAIVNLLRRGTPR